MAKIQFGTIVTDIRGKLGGQVFKKTNTGHAITRKGAPPRNTLTKSNERFQRVLQVSRSYRDLTIAEKTFLKNFAIANPSKDVFGNDIILTARAMYQKLCCNLSITEMTKPVFSALSSVIPVTTIAYVRFQTSNDNLDFNVNTFSGPVALKIWVTTSAFESLTADVNRKVLFGKLDVTARGIARFDLSPDQVDYFTNINQSYWCGVELLNSSGYTSSITWYFITRI